MLSERGVNTSRRKPIAFLDRDGVLNKDLGYVCTPERFQLTDGAPEAIRRLNEQGYRVVVVTNQSGIARGYYSQQEFERFMEWVVARLAKSGARLDAYYYCPHHPTEGIGPLKTVCRCRKPQPGMLEQALRDFPTRVEASFLIGDRANDLVAAERAGLRGILFDSSGNLEETVIEILDAIPHLSKPRPGADQVR